jgi:hypothetical protein
MPLPEEIREMVERRLSEYCRVRVPEHLRGRVRVGYKIRGRYVTLFQERPDLLEPRRWVDIPVAQFRFQQDVGAWTLHWTDHTRRWHNYRDVEPTEKFEDLLLEVDRDPTGILWG